MRPGVFVVEDIESRQTNVGDFFLIESKCAVRRRSIARRTNGRSGRAARQRQRPSDSQYRYRFRPTLSLRTSLAMRHGGGLSFTPALLCNYTTTTAATNMTFNLNTERHHFGNTSFSQQVTGFDE